MPEAMPATDRLSGLDEAFLALDTARSPMHVGWTIRFGGTPPTLAALRRHLRGHLPHVAGERRPRVDHPAGVASHEPRVRSREREPARVAGAHEGDIVGGERVGHAPAEPSSRQIVRP